MVLLTSDTVGEVCYNERYGLMIVATIDGDVHLLKMSCTVLRSIVHHFDLVRTDQRKIEDAAGKWLPFTIYHKRPRQLTYAMSA